MPSEPCDYTHPDDRAALENLKRVPLFPACVKAFMKFFPERLLHGLNMANKVRLGPRQLPQIYRLLPGTCEALGIDEPEFYLEMNPFPNAYTYGDKRIFVTVTSGLLDHLDDAQARAVVAHECGHIACQHVLYHTMARLMIDLGSRVFGPLAAVSLPVRIALLYWLRRSELSADRAAACVMQGCRPVVEVMSRLAGGPKSITENLNLALYAKQAEAYDKLMESKWDQILQGLAILPQTHPFLAVRTREIMRWARTEEFKKAALKSRRRLKLAAK